MTVFTPLLMTIGIFADKERRNRQADRHHGVGRDRPLGYPPRLFLRVDPPPAHVRPAGADDWHRVNQVGGGQLAGNGPKQTGKALLPVLDDPHSLRHFRLAHHPDRPGLPSMTRICPAPSINCCFIRGPAPDSCAELPAVQSASAAKDPVGPPYDQLIPPS